MFFLIRSEIRDKVCPVIEYDKYQLGYNVINYRFS